MAMKFLRPSFFRELLSLIPCVPEEYQNQIEILPLDETNLNIFKCKVTPLRGPYQHASFIFRVGSRSSYPDRAPTVSCLTPIFHPNIHSGSDSDNICLNILSNWTRRYGLKELLHAILFLLYEPNPEDPNNSDSHVPDGMTFDECVKLALRGGKVNNIQYRPNEAWCKWASESGLLTDKVTSQTEQVESDNRTPVLDKQISLDHQLSTDLFRPFVETEFHSITSLQTVSSRNSYSPDCGLWCWYVTLSPASLLSSSITKNPYLTRYYHVKSFDLHREQSIYMEDQDIVMLPVRDCDLPTVLQKAWMQYWNVEGETGYRYRYFADTGADDANSIVSEQTQSEVFSLPSQNDQDQQEELGDEWQDRACPDEPGEPETVSQTNDPVQQEQEKTDEVVEETDDKVEDTDANVEEDGDKQADEGDEQKEDPVEAQEHQDENPQTDEVQNDQQDLGYSEGLDDPQDDDHDASYDDEAYWLSPYSQQEFRRFVRHLRPFWWWMYKTNWPQPFVPGYAYVYERSQFCPTVCRIVRAALGQLRADVNHLSKTYPPNSHIILVDPLALSPLTPILNHLVRLPVLEDSPAIVWRSTEWMSLSWALNPPPYPAELKRSAMKGSLPVACLCLLSNWLAYGSRLETYTCLGYSRRLSLLFFDSLAITCLTPARLSPDGSGLLFDGWPLWLTVQLTRWLSSVVSSLLNRSPMPNGMPVRTHFVFTDVDEI